MLLAAIALGGCAFDGGGGAGAGGEGDAAPTPDAEPVACAPGTTVCSGHNLETCNQSGDGFVASATVVCPLSCEEDDHCTAASNLPIDGQLLCGAEPAASLIPDADATVTLSDSGGGVQIDCSSCGGAPVTLVATGTVEQGDVDLAWFCLSALLLVEGVEVRVDPSVTSAVGFLVDGEVVVAGAISAGGGAATTLDAGAGGPGGGAGGALALDNGLPGSGPCFGGGGSRAGTTGDHGSGGGAGGGHLGAGGDGGDGRNPSDTATGGGGLGGASGCGAEELVPLVGGGGGGSGSDGSCSGVCGWAGGGGGGAIQISSRQRIEVAGTIAASGGDGFGSVEGTSGRGGAGGGGAGGAILLEAPALTISGKLLVEGGSGGVSGAGPGADGASAAQMNGSEAADGNAAGEGGPGGGGGGGRIRLNTLVTVMCAAVSTPRGSCTASPLVVPASAR